MGLLDRIGSAVSNAVSTAENAVSKVVDEVAPAPAPAAPVAPAATDALDAPGKGPKPSLLPPDLQKAVAAVPKDSTISAADQVKLKDRLAKMDPATRAKETDFLENNVLNQKNPDRGLATYLQLKTMQDARPDRLSNDYVHELTQGVATARSNGNAGQEGVLGKQGALDSATALTTMPQADYDALTKSMGFGGPRDNVCEASGADVHTERELTLKAVGARKDDLAKPGFFDKCLNAVGLPSSKMQEVLQYEQKIAGTPRADLIKKSTLIDLDGGTGALQQRFSDSCGPTSMEIGKAEADPIYALKMHDDTVHSTSTTGPIADEQKGILNGNGGNAVPRTSTGGIGMWPEAGNTLDNMVGQMTGKKYAKTTLADTPAARKGALDRAATQLKNGVDVPIVVAWNGGGSHVQMLTDVRGTGKDQQFLLTDPWNGQTMWMKRADIEKGNTNFGAGTGRLWVTYE